jgi:hypothetical protein
VGIDLQPRVEHQLCVPAIEMNVESYRRRVAAARTPRKPRGGSDSKSDSQTA